MARPPVRTPPEAIPQELPDPIALADVFGVYEVSVSDDAVRYYGTPMIADEEVLERVAPQFREAGYRVTLRRETGEYVLVAQERSVGVDGVPWTNVALFGATVLTTLFAGTQWYGISVVEQPLRLLEG